ncbi:MAG: histidine kinase [Ruminococcus sp.]|nr:histidine kinase [Ruminococcus sp.]
MTKKILKSILAVAAAAMIASIVLVTALLNRYSAGKTADELELSGRLIASAVEMNGGRYLDHTRFSDIRVTWIEPGGRVIFDSDEDPGGMDNHSDREEVISAFRTGEGSSSRYSSTLMHMTLNYAVQLSDGSVIRVSDVHHSFMGQLAAMASPLVMLLVAAAAMCLVYAFIAARRIVRPINDIDLDSPDIKGSYSELSPLLTKLREQNRRVSRQMEELRQQSSRLSLITESMSEGLVIADPHYSLLACNSAAMRLLGADVQPDEAASRTIFSLNRTETFRRCIQNAMGGRGSRCILPIQNEGECEVIASPVRVSDTVNGIVVLVLDVTERRRLEAMRKEFTSNVSHELKTPLTTIYGSADMLAGGLVRQEDQVQFAETIRSEADRMITLINDIISLSKLDEGNVAQEDEDIELYSLSADILRRLASVSEKKGVSCLLSGEHAVFHGSRTILDEIISNLCSNAIKYNKDGGSMEVRVTHTTGGIMLSVSDTGIGMTAEQLSRAFERFYRADKSRSRKIEGTGLGLSIVKHGVEYLGGSVTAESTPGKGSVFTVRLPDNCGKIG